MNLSIEARTFYILTETEGEKLWGAELIIKERGQAKKTFCTEPVMTVEKAEMCIFAQLADMGLKHTLKNWDAFTK